MNKIKQFVRWVIIFPGILSAISEADDIYYVPQITQNITLDGAISESVWDTIDPIPLVTHWPQFGKAPSEDTEIRICFDKTYFYLAAK